MAHVLKVKTDKMELRTNLYIFVGYPRGMKEYFFHSTLDNKII